MQKGFSQTTERNRPLGRLGIYGNIILEWFLKKQDGMTFGMDSSGSGQGEVADLRGKGKGIL